MIGASPRYVDDGPYIGGFSREDIESLLATLDRNYLGWSSTMAPVSVMAGRRPKSSGEPTSGTGVRP